MRQLPREHPLYDLLFRESAVPGCVYDPESLRVFDVNRAAESHSGFSREELLGMTPGDLHVREAIEDEAAHRVAADAPLCRHPGTFKHRRKDGPPVEVEIVSQPFSYGDRPARLALAFDVTEQRVAQERLRKLSRAVEQSPLAIMITDASGAIEYVNPHFTVVTGYAAQEVQGQNPRLLKSAHTPAELYVDLWRTITAGREWRGEVLNRKKSGEPFWGALTIGPIVDGQGRITHFVSVTENITDRRRAAEILYETQQQLLQAQKIEAVGRLAGGISHDFNNLLNVIRGYGEIASRSLAPDHPSRRHLDQLLGATDRAAVLTRQLLAFSRRQVLSPKILDLGARLTEMGQMLQRLIGEDVDLEVRAADDLGRVKVDPGQLEQVVMNLTANARDAMPKGGRLLIEVANVDLDATYAATHEPVQPGAFVMLAVSDTGVGMDKATAARIFEPFFTTKPEGRGTGLGLSTVYGIVKQSEGFIWVYSEPNRGTKFRIYLPRFSDPATEAEVPMAFPPEIGGHETVLLVEDQPAVRAVAREHLLRLGYRVLEAGDGEEAVAVAASTGHPIDLLLTDVIMPRLNGPDLAARLRASQPDLRVVFMSGYSGDMVSDQGVLAEGTLLIEKPFTGAALGRKVREALSAPR